MVDTQDYIDSDISGHDENNRLFLRLRKRF